GRAGPHLRRPHRRREHQAPRGERRARRAGGRRLPAGRRHGARRGRKGLSDDRRIDPEALGRPQNLGDLLRSARESRGLSLADVAELTHVRQEYLRALEESRYADLPEDVYARNFVRLFAQAVGVDTERALSAYQSERKQAGGLTTLEMRLEQERRGEKPPPPRRRRRSESRDRPGFSLGPLIPTLVLVAGLVALAVWGFNRLMAPSRPGGAQLDQ